jgi:hypothetical protein
MGAPAVFAKVAMPLCDDALRIMFGRQGIENL